MNELTLIKGREMVTVFIEGLKAAGYQTLVHPLSTDATRAVLVDGTLVLSPAMA
ncbi:hypothetical protein GCM10027341_16750 [Spirosoma knui]